MTAKFKLEKYYDITFPRDVSNLKIYMLHLGKILSSGFKLQQIFEDLKQKYEGDFIYGKMFIAETIVYIVDTLDMVIFHLNAATGGQYISMYRKLDNLKNRLNGIFEGGPDSPSLAVDSSNIKIDPLANLLREIMKFSEEAGIPPDHYNFENMETLYTARELLNYCYYRLLEDLRDKHDSLIREAGGSPELFVQVIGLPVSFLQTDIRVKPENNFPSNRGIEDTLSNFGALKFHEGLYEVYNSDYYTPFLEEPARRPGIAGVLIYSNETLVLYSISNRYNFLITANICDAVGGNFINLLASSTSSHDNSAFSLQLIKRLLDWLDFHTFSGFGLTTASITNITRNNMLHHLNIMGKLISFATATKIPPSDEDSVALNIEDFLENVV